MALLLDLPNELLFQITIYLTHHDIFHFLRANRRLARLLQTAQFDHLRRFRSVDHGRRALFHAAAREDTATVAELVRIGAHKFPGSRIHFLNSAIQNWCSAKTISIFLRCGIEADGTDTRGRTPLTIAARKGRADVVEVLLKVEGVRVNAQCHNGKTPFMLAALAGRTDVVRLLLEDERVDVGLRDTMPNSCTVLWKAVEIGHRKVIKLLLDDGRSDPNFLSNGQTPLHCAIQRGHPEVVLLLL
ncbi:ankyrin, partial [Tuber magnatum]